MKKSKKLILKCITALMIVSCVVVANEKSTQALYNERAYTERVKSFQIDSYVMNDFTGTRYLYKDLTFTNTFWLIDKTFYKTVWNGLVAFDHHYKFNYGTK